MKTYFLFGKEAVDLYHWGNSNTAEKARVLLNEYTYDPWDVVCYDNEKDNPKYLLDKYTGYSNYCIVTEEFFNLLK